MNSKRLKDLIKQARWDLFYKASIHKPHDRTRFLHELHELDHDFHNAIVALDKTGLNILDIGTGYGYQAIYMEQLGHKVTGIDIAHTAIDQAQKYAKNHQSNVQFIQGNFLSYDFSEPFDLVTDRGCFTLLPIKEKAQFIHQLNQIIHSNSLILMKLDKSRTKTDLDDHLLVNFKLKNLSSSCYVNNLHQKIDANFVILTR